MSTVGAEKPDLAVRWISWISGNGGKWAACWLLIAAALGTGAGLLKDRLKVGGFSIPGTQFYEASRVLTRDFGMASEKLIVAALRSERYRASEPEFRDAAQALALPCPAPLHGGLDRGVPLAPSRMPVNASALFHGSG